MDIDHGAANFGYQVALGTPKPRPPRGRPDGNGVIAPGPTTTPGLGSFGSPKPGKTKASQVKA